MNKDDFPKEIIFAPGCFDKFEGTQEELNELIAQIKNMFETGEIFEKMEPVPDEVAERIFSSMDMDSYDPDPDTALESRKKNLN